MYSYDFLVDTNDVALMVKLKIHNFSRLYKL